MSRNVQWMYRPRSPTDSRVRLVCFPYAGASAAAYRSWPAHLPDWVEVCSVQLPGRGWRLAEAPLDDLDLIVSACAEAVATQVDPPLALFGHSFGAWVAFGVARALAGSSSAPVALFVSGRNAPSRPPSGSDLHRLSDSDFVTRINERYGGIPQEILAERELLDLLLPALRADVRALETSSYHPAAPLDCPILAFAGEGDGTLDREGMEAWRGETNGKFSVHTFPGGHFFIEPSAARLLQFIGDELAILPDPAGSGQA